MFERPNDERGFIHKRIIGAVGGLVSGQGIGGAIRGFVRGGRKRRPGGQNLPALRPAAVVVSPARPVPPRGVTARPSEFSKAEKRVGTEVKFGGGGTMTDMRLRPDARAVRPPQRTPCDFPMVRDSEGRCRTPTSGATGGEQFGVGEAVMGRYGAGLEPGSMIIDRAVCLKGMHLGNDGLCYNHSQISNKQRMWPRGRRPLLTGGEMRAITIAANAGKRLAGAQKRLQAIGLMKKPARRTALPRHQHAKQISAVSV